jgi:Uma2 family endonuclease
VGYNGWLETLIMATAEKRRITPQQYLARERAAETRSEYFNGEMFAMSGATWEHTLIKDNLARALGNQLEGGPCRAATSDLRVKVDATGLYTYPDIVIVCGQPQFEDNVLDTLLNPTAIVEVLSESTEKYDRGGKFAHYRQLPMIQEYILVSQDRPLVERFVRQTDGSWLLTEFAGLETRLPLASVPAEVPLAEIYRGVDFSAGRQSPADRPA